MSKLKDVFYSLLNRVDTVENDWEKAHESKHAELLELTVQRQEKEYAYGDLQRMVLLNQVTEATFEKEKSELEALKAKEASILQDMKMIEEYKTADISKVIEELEKAKIDYTADASEEVDALRYKIMKAKQAYLQTMIDVSKEYSKISEPQHKFQEVLIKAGKQKHVYASSADDVLSQLSIKDGGYEQLTIDRQTVYDALSYHKMPYGVERAIKQGEKAGNITG